MFLTKTGDVTLVFHKVQDKWKEQIPKTRFPGVIMSLCDWSCDLGTQCKVSNDKWHLISWILEKSSNFARATVIKLSVEDIERAKWIKLSLRKASSLCNSSSNFLAGNMEEKMENNSPYQ